MLVKTLPYCHQVFAHTLRHLSKSGWLYIEVNCYLISENGYVKFDQIIIQFADKPIFWDNGILQRCDLWNDKLRNSIY